MPRVCRLIFITHVISKQINGEATLVVRMKGVKRAFIFEDYTVVSASVQNVGRELELHSTSYISNCFRYAGPGPRSHSFTGGICLKGVIHVTRRPQGKEEEEGSTTLTVSTGRW